MKYDQFSDAGVRWLAADNKGEMPAGSTADVDAQSPSSPSWPSEVKSSGFPIYLYSNRGFRLRIELRARCADGTAGDEAVASQATAAESCRDDTESGMAPIVLSIDQATSFDWDNREWNEWSKLRQVNIETLDELLVTIAEWSTWLGEEDKTGEADVHALLSDFME